MTIELNISNVILSPELNAAQITITPVFSSGQITPEERAKLAGIEENANNYTHPETHPSSILDVVDAVDGAANKFLNERGEMVAVAHESLTDKNSEAAFQHVDITTTKPALDAADMVAVKDSLTGKVVLTPKSNLQTAVVQNTGTSETDVMSQKAVTDEIAQLAGEMSQAVKKTDSKIYIGAVQTELDWMYNGTSTSSRLGTVLSDERFICGFGSNLTAFNDVMGISWQRTDISASSIPYERDGYIYVASATQLYKLTLDGIDVKTYPLADITSVAVAPNGNIVVGRNGAVGEKTVIYMDNDGLEIWSNTEVANCSAVDIDGNGNILAGHYISVAGDGLRIYNSAGVKQKQIGRIYIADAKFDNDSNVIVLSSVSSAGIYKYDKSLNQLWYRSEVASNSNSRSKVSIGDDNTIYVPSFSTTAGAIDCFRLTTDGDLIYKFASGGAARASSFVPDNNGYVYLTCNLNANNTLSRFKEYNKVRIW